MNNSISFKDIFVSTFFFTMFSIHSTGNSISAVRLLQSEDVHPDPGRQRAREVEVGVRSERAAPHP